MKQHIMFDSHLNAYARTAPFRYFLQNIKKKYRLTGFATERAPIAGTAGYDGIGKEIVSKFITEHWGKGERSI